MKTQGRRQSENVVDRRGESKDPLTGAYQYTKITGIMVFDAINKLLFEEDDVALKELPNQLKAMEELFKIGSVQK